MNTRITVVDRPQTPSFQTMFTPPSSLDLSWEVPCVNNTSITLYNKMELSPAVHQKTMNIQDQAFKNDLKVFPLPCAIETFDEQRVLVTPDSELAWLFDRWENDPLREEPNGYPIPREIIDEVTHVENCLGKPFDDYYIAHEFMKKDWNGGRVTAEMLRPPPSRIAQHKSQALGNMSQGVWSRLGKLGREAVKATAQTVTAIPSAAATAAEVAVALLDPILFGVVIDPSEKLRTGIPAQFFYITHWDYSESNVQVLPANQPKLLGWTRLRLP